MIAMATSLRSQANFIAPILRQQSPGSPVSVADTLDLKQNNNTISGTFTSAYTLVDCCTATTNVSVSGTADGLSAYLTWSGSEARCQCAEWTFTVTTGPVAAHATLLDNKGTLRFEGGAELLRMSIAGENRRAS